MHTFKSKFTFGDKVAYKKLNATEFGRIDGIHFTRTKNESDEQPEVEVSYDIYSPDSPYAKQDGMLLVPESFIFGIYQTEPPMDGMAEAKSSIESETI